VTSPEKVKLSVECEEEPRVELLELLEALEEGRNIIQGTATCLPLLESELLAPALRLPLEVLPPTELLSLVLDLLVLVLLPTPELDPVVPEVAAPVELELLLSESKPNSILPVFGLISTSLRVPICSPELPVTCAPCNWEALIS
jgi:hypothetical protein